jgi:outer membrane protein assembly factor BamB
VKVRLSFIKAKLRKVSILLVIVAALSLVVVGCVGGPTSQGWSGFAGHDGILYFGSMDGRVFAVNPLARIPGLPFPGEGEWVLRVRALSAPRGMCGPLGCAPSAQPVTFYGAPAIAGNLVYVATYAGDSGKVMAINREAPGYDEQGIPAWNEGEWFYPRSETKFIGAIVGSPIVAEDTLYVGASDGKVYALDAVKGDERCMPFDTGGKIWTSPAVKDGVVYVGNYKHQLFALSSHDLTPVWKSPIELPAAIASSPIISGNIIFFGTFNNYVYAIDGNDGSEKWKFKGDGWFWANPVVQDGVVYAACLDDKIYALDSSTGKELWQFAVDGQIASTPVLLDKLLVAVSEPGEMYIIELASGTLQRTVSIGSAVMAPLYASDTMVYVHARNRCIYAVDVDKGKIAWKFSYSDIK